MGAVLTFISVWGAFFLNFLYLEKLGLCLSVLEEREMDKPCKGFAFLPIAWSAGSRFD